MNFVEIKRNFKIGVITLIGLCFMILFVPIILPLLLFFWLVSQLAFLCIKLKYGKLVSKPSGLDIVNGKENTISRPFINIAFRFTQRNPDVESVRQRFQKVVLDQRDKSGKQIFGKFTKIFEKVCGYYVWRDSENFDLKNHIRLLDTKVILDKYLKENKIKKESSKAKKPENKTDLAGIKWEVILNILLSDTGASPVQENLPKWEILILPETENRYTTLFRVHHSITDGLYFVRLISECLADTPVDIRLPFKIRKGNFLQRTLLNIWSFCLLPYGLYRALTCNDRNPLHGPKLNGKKRFVVADPLSMNLLKDIRKVAKVTINDIIFSCVSYAAVKHFDLRNASIEQITVLLAVNLQEQNKPLRLKNNFAVTALKLPTSSIGFLKNSSENKQCTILIDKTSLYDLSKMPALSRLQIVKNSLDEAKNDPCLMSVCWLLTSFSFLLPASIAEALLSTKGITMDISNIQGPQNNEFVMHNAPAEDVCFWLPDRDPLGIGVSIVSYNGFMRTGLIVDESLMSNDEECYNFLSNFRQEVLNLHREVMSLKTTQEKTESEFSAFLPKDIP